MLEPLRKVPPMRFKCGYLAPRHDASRCLVRPEARINTISGIAEQQASGQGGMALGLFYEPMG
jgi:hypothetical protein